MVFLLSTNWHWFAFVFHNKNYSLEATNNFGTRDLMKPMHKPFLGLYCKKYDNRSSKSSLKQDHLNERLLQLTVRYICLRNRLLEHFINYHSRLYSISIISRSLILKPSHGKFFICEQFKLLLPRLLWPHLINRKYKRALQIEVIIICKVDHRRI